MTRSIIASRAGGNGDGDRTELVIKRLQTALDNDGHPDPRRVVEEARQMAAESDEPWSAEKKAKATAYIAALAEPHRTIFESWQNRMKIRDIAKATGLGEHQIRKSLARTYSDLLHR